MSATYRGTCLCGSVTFELCGEFQSFYLCHCHRCQKDTGSAHAAKQRAWFLSLCGEMGSEHQLMYLDVTDAVLGADWSTALGATGARQF